MRFLMIAVLLVIAAVLLDVPALAWVAFAVALLGLAASAAFGLFVFLIFVAIAAAAACPRETRR